jgi:guanylate kinase
MINRVKDYYDENRTEIEEAKPGDGSAYIFRVLWEALNAISMASAETVTIKSASMAEIEHRRQRNLSTTQERILSALCELIDQDYELV